MAKKMNLDFLLSPDKDNNNTAASSSTASRLPRPEPRRLGPSPLSLDCIPPPSTDSSHHFSTYPQSLFSRRWDESASSHSYLPPPNAWSTPPPQRTSTTATAAATAAAAAAAAAARDQSTSSKFKGKKGKSSTPLTTLHPPSAGETKPHVCPNCERSFYKLEQLKRHNRLVHLNLRPFVCHTCDLSFGTKQNMQVHLTTRKHQHRLETLQGRRSSSQHGGSSRSIP